MDGSPCDDRVFFFTFRKYTHNIRLHQQWWKLCKWFNFYDSSGSAIATSNWCWVNPAKSLIAKHGEGYRRKLQNDATTIRRRGFGPWTTQSVRCIACQVDGGAPATCIRGRLPASCLHDNRTAAAAADVLVQTTPIYILISHEIQMTEPLERVSLFIC